MGLTVPDDGGILPPPPPPAQHAHTTAVRPRSYAKLQNTETSLFFPWLRELIPENSLPPLGEFDREREGVVRIGNKIGQVCVMSRCSLYVCLLRAAAVTATAIADAATYSS